MSHTPIAPRDTEEEVLIVIDDPTTGRSHVERVKGKKPQPHRPKPLVS